MSVSELESIVGRELKPLSLLYFQGRARGERLRWILLASEIANGHLPVLFDHGRQINDSFVIAQYLADKFGLEGTTTEDRSTARDHVHRVFETDDKVRASGILHFIHPRRGNGDVQSAQQYWDEHVHGPIWKPHCDHFERVLAANKPNEWLVASTFTWADIILAEFVYRQCSLQAESDQYPNLKSHCNRVSQLGAIKQHNLTRIIYYKIDA